MLWLASRGSWLVNMRQVNPRYIMITCSVHAFAVSALSYSMGVHYRTT
jgi:hypothetical protein